MTDAELAELLRTVIARPDDHDVLRIYADCLLERDDPRGELIAIQLQRRVDPTDALVSREREVIARLDAALAIELGQPGFAASWRNGFLEAADFTPVEQRKALADTIRQLGTMPVARQLRRIVVRLLWPGWGATGPIISALTKVAPQLRQLRELVFTTSPRLEDDTTRPVTQQLGVLAGLFAALPKLEVLEVASTSYPTLRSLQLPALRRLVLEEPTIYDVSALDDAAIPNLEQLVIHGGAWQFANLEPFLFRALPLRQLTLVPRDQTLLQLLCRNVPDAPLFRGVQTFVLGGKLDRTCIEYLEHHAVQLRRLQRFAIEDAAAAKRLKKVLGDCVVVGD